MSIYAALGVPEVWRWNGETLGIWVLSKKQTYTSSDYSLAFPFLKASELERFVHFQSTLSDTQIVRAFRE